MAVVMQYFVQAVGNELFAREDIRQQILDGQASINTGNGHLARKPNLVEQVFELIALLL